MTEKIIGALSSCGRMALSIVLYPLFLAVLYLYFSYWDRKSKKLGYDPLAKD